MQISSREYLTFDDVLLVPSKSLPSRETPILDTQIQFMLNESIARHIHIFTKHPIVPANMDTICGKEMAIEVVKSGGIAIIHRFMSYEDRLDAYNEAIKFAQVNDVNPLVLTGYPLAPLESLADRFGPSESTTTYVGFPVVSIGCSKDEVSIAKKLIDAGVIALCIDVANGYSDAVAEAIIELRNYQGRKPLWIIAGNVATVEAFQFLVDAGADTVKVGIGPGSHCTTRLVTGCGVPQLSAIMDIFRYKSENDVSATIIADGGVKNSGDILKALVAGADLVMSGSLFAGCKETPGEIVNGMKVYRGMASKDAQVDWRKTDPDKIVPEGESSLVPYKGTYNSQLQQLIGGIKSGMSYLSCELIYDLSQAQFIRVSTNTLVENRPHGKRN